MDINIENIRKERNRLSKKIYNMRKRMEAETVDEIDSLEDVSNWTGWRDALNWVLKGAKT